jgi:hypothetical protein
VLALAAGLGLVLWPCAYQGAESRSTPGGVLQERQFCVGFLEANGVDALGVLALPVLLAGVGLLAVRACRRRLLVAATVALVVLCLLALASVGLLYLPAAGALVTAVVGWRHQQPTQAVPRRQQPRPR